jgi:hypothetical protein
LSESLAINIILKFKTLLMSQIFFIENPLLDISVELKDNSILDKYKLQHGMASLAGPD